jgi:hypothetical protein
MVARVGHSPTSILPAQLRYSFGIAIFGGAVQKTLITLPDGLWDEFLQAAKDDDMPAAQVLRKLMRNHLAERKAASA